jgi:galactose oxidase
MQDLAVCRGQKSPLVFTDGTAQLTPELWDPASEQFNKLAPGPVPRTYHRCAMLRVTANHLAICSLSPL